VFKIVLNFQIVMVSHVILVKILLPAVVTAGGVVMGCAVMKIRHSQIVTEAMVQ